MVVGLRRRGHIHDGRGSSAPPVFECWSMDRNAHRDKRERFDGLNLAFLRSARGPRGPIVHLFAGRNQLRGLHGRFHRHDQVRDVELGRQHNVAVGRRTDLARLWCQPASFLPRDADARRARRFVGTGREGLCPGSLNDPGGLAPPDSLVYSRGFARSRVIEPGRGWAYAALFSEIGISLLVTTLAGVLAGYWVDTMLGTLPIFVIVGFLGGAGSGTVIIYRLLTRFLKTIK